MLAAKRLDLAIVSARHESDYNEAKGGAAVGG